jgi:catechol 2,3-dioxygenase-like lactoylglutathione lyase family enzyme
VKLDHVIVAVADLDAAVATYETILGLPAAIRSEHPAYGTRNAIFLFRQGPFLELLAPQSGVTGGFAGRLCNALARKGDGLFGMALAPDGLDAAIGRLRTLGLDVPDAIEGSGVSPDGSTRRWRGTMLQPSVWHGAVSMLIEYHDLAWRTELRRSPVSGHDASAVSGIHHIVFDVADAETASDTWEERFGLSRRDTIVSERAGAVVNVHAAGDATIEAVSPTTPDGMVAERMARRGEGMSSIAFEVADVDAGVAALRAAGLTITEPAPGVLPNSRVARIDPDSACGVAAQLLQFE